MRVVPKAKADAAIEEVTDLYANCVMEKAELLARAGKAEALLEFALEEWERGEIPPDDMAELVARYEAAHE